MAGSKPRERIEGGDFSKESLLAYIRNQPERSAGFSHILDDFGADKTDRKQIKDILDQLVKEEKLVRYKGNRYEAPPSVALYTGRISLHADGYGFVYASKKYSRHNRRHIHSASKVGS